MGKYTSIILASVCTIGTLFFSFFASQSAYFSPREAAGSVHVNHKTYQPVLVPITAQLYTNSFAPQTTNPYLRGLWYGKQYGYKIGSADVLAITVWDHPELSTPMRLSMQSAQKTIVDASAMNDNIIPGILVNAEGKIFYPYAGLIHVSGLTVDQLRTLLVKKLKHTIRNPQINVRVVNFRSKTLQVLGAVNQQGSVPISDDKLSIFDAIALRGGVNTISADTHHIFVIRGSGLKPIIFILNASSPSNLLVAQNFKLLDHDIIFVPQSNLANWNHFLSQMLPTLAASAYARTITR